MEFIDALFGGLLGSLIGAGLAFAITKWQRRQDELGAIRALFLEVAYVSSKLAVMAEGGVWIPVATSTWQATRSIVATALSPAEFMNIGVVMLRVSTIEDAGVRLAPSDPLPPGILKTVRDIVPSVEEVSKLIEERGWSGSGLASLRAAGRRRIGR